MDLIRVDSPSGGGDISGKDLIVGDLFTNTLKALPHGFTGFTSMQLQLKDATNNDEIDQLYYDATNVYIKATVDVPSAAGLIVSCLVYKETPTPAPTPSITIVPTTCYVSDSSVNIVITGFNTNFQATDTILVSCSGSGSATAAIISVDSPTSMTIQIYPSKITAGEIMTITIQSSYSPPTPNVSATMTVLADATITINPVNALTTESPLSVVITGVNTNFTIGDTVEDTMRGFGKTKITIEDVVVISTTEIHCTFIFDSMMSPNPYVATHEITVHSTTDISQNFIIADSFITIVPASSQYAAFKNVDVVITARGTLDFETNFFGIIDSGGMPSDITIINEVVISPTQLNCTFVMSDIFGGITEIHSMRVNYLNGYFYDYAYGDFEILTPPSITAIPSTASTSDSPLNLRIIGTDTNFQEGDTVTLTGMSGIVYATNVVVVSPTEIVCVLTYDSVMIGVDILTVNSTPSVSTNFEITAPLTITITPSSAITTESPLAITIDCGFSVPSYHTWAVTDNLGTIVITDIATSMKTKKITCTFMFNASAIDVHTISVLMDGTLMASTNFEITQFVSLIKNI